MQPLCHPRIETLTRYALANSKLSAVADKERREIGFEQSVQTIPGSMKGDTSPAGEAVDDIGPLFGSPRSSGSTSARQVRCESGQRVRPRCQRMATDEDRGSTEFGALHQLE